MDEQAPRQEAEASVVEGERMLAKVTRRVYEHEGVKGSGEDEGAAE